MLGSLIVLCQHAGVGSADIVQAVVADLDSKPGVDVDNPMTEELALSFGIFALNTWLVPEASDMPDIEELERRANEVVHVLVALWNAYRQP